MKFITKIVCLAVCCLTGSVFAATQGTVGPTSQGTLLITVTIPAWVRISNLVNLTLAPVDGTSPATNNEDVCIYSNIASHKYRIKAGSATGGSGAFTLTGTPGNTDTIPYSVTWYDKTGNIGGGGTVIPLTAGVVSGDIASGSKFSNCGGTNNASLLVSVEAADYTSVANDNYTGTLYIVVSPP